MFFLFFQLNNNIICLGQELSEAFASSDIFVMPSDSETLGFVVMEAMASGLPVVGIAAGGVVDLIEHGKTGFLVSNEKKKGNYDENDYMLNFSAHVSDLIANISLRRSMGEAAMQWAQGWSWEAATSKLRNIQYPKAIALHKCRDYYFYQHDVDIENTVMNYS